MIFNKYGHILCASIIFFFTGFISNSFFSGVYVDFGLHSVFYFFVLVLFLSIALNVFLLWGDTVIFLYGREKRLRKIIDTMPYILTVRNKSGHIILANQYVASSLHIPLKCIHGKHFSSVYRHLDEETIRNQLQLDYDVMSKGIDYFDSEEIVKDIFGVCRVYQSHRFPFVQDNKTMVLCVAIDVTEQKAKERRMKKLAFFDELTGLPNRAAIYSNLKKEVKRAQRHQLSGAVMFVDLDYFKEINDNFGHKIGDEVLKQVGQRLKENLRGEDMVARLSGDEFIVLLPDIDGNKKTVEVFSLQVAEKMRKALEEPFLVNEGSHCVSASIGVVIFPEVSSSVEAILDLADAAMYTAKRYGKNSVKLIH